MTHIASCYKRFQKLVEMRNPFWNLELMKFLSAASTSISVSPTRSISTYASHVAFYDVVKLMEASWTGLHAQVIDNVSISPKNASSLLNTACRYLRHLPSRPPTEGGGWFRRNYFHPRTSALCHSFSVSVNVNFLLFFGWKTSTVSCFVYFSKLKFTRGKFPRHSSAISIWNVGSSLTGRILM